MDTKNALDYALVLLLLTFLSSITPTRESGMFFWRRRTKWKSSRWMKLYEMNMDFTTEMEVKRLNAAFESELKRINATYEIEFRRINSEIEYENRRIDYEIRKIDSELKIAAMICISIIFVAIYVGEGPVLKIIKDHVGKAWNTNNISNKTINFITGLFAVALGLVGNIVKTILFWKR